MRAADQVFAVFGGQGSWPDAIGAANTHYLARACQTAIFDAVNSFNQSL